LIPPLELEFPAMDDSDLLKHSRLFESFSDPDLRFILENTEERHVFTGETLFRAGGAAIHFFLLKSGEVSLLKGQEDGSAQELAHYAAGESFGEFEFAVSAVYETEAVAVKDSSCLIFPAFSRTLDSLAIEQPQVITLLYFNFLNVLSERLRSVHSLIFENAPWVRHLQEQVYMDKLTGMYTRMFLDENIPNLLRPPVALILVKPDHFKELNDLYGHQAGDTVLSRLGDAYLEMIKKRQKGWAVRLRSNETAILLQESNREEAVEMANALAAAVTRLSPALATGSATIRLSASIVISIYEGRKQGWQVFFNTTYAYMKKVWEEGGNRICILSGKAQEPGGKETRVAIRRVADDGQK
jgi:diguanylate cyclase